MSEIEYVIEKAREVFTPEGVEIWIGAPNPLLDGRTPRDLVEAGETNRVLALIDALASGAFL
jgi:uncharacterized protein (DUF2384 family)